MLLSNSILWNILSKLGGDCSYDFYTPYIICALVLKAKENGLSLDTPSQELISRLYGNEYSDILHDIKINDLSSFDAVGTDELKLFIKDSQFVFSRAGKESAEFFVPEKIITLFCKLLELENTDKLVMIGESSPISALQIANSYSLSSVITYSLNVRNKKIAEFIADALGYAIKFIAGEYYLFNYIERTNKAICFPMWNSRTEHTVMGTYLEEKGYKACHNNSAEAGIHFALDVLTENGTAAVCVPLSLLSKGDNPVLKDIVDKKHVKAVISLPGGIFPATNIKTAILLLTKKQNETVRFVNGSEFFIKNRKLCNELSDTNIMEIANAYYNNSEYAKDVTAEEIREKDYSLNYINYFVEPKIIIPGMGRNKYPSVKLADLLIAKPIRGTLIKSEVLDSETGITSFRYLTSKNIVDNEINTEQLPEIPEQDRKIDKYCLNENDIILSVVTTDVIKVAIARDIGDLNIVVSNMLYKLTPNPDKVLPLFLKAVLSTPAAVRLFRAYSTGAGATSTLPIDVLCNTEITLPPLEKQNVFVKNYEELMNTRSMLVEQINKIDKSKDLLFVKSFQEK